MKSFRSVPIRSSEITPEHIYLNRRAFMKFAGAASAAALLAACAPLTTQTPTGAVEMDQTDSTTSVSMNSDEAGDPINTFEQITNYNNFYEFSFDKEGIGELAKDFSTSPWQIQVGGLVQKPMTFSMEDILKKFPSQERIYRLRCVEGWSMVIPWLGFPLASLLKEVEPMGSANYVAFQTALDDQSMPNLSSMFPWPYTEGLRINEAMHDLTILVTGLYGKELPNQNGAPLRLTVPWKYGFKSIKSIVKIDLVETMPATLWSTIAPDEYGFFANVNPDVPHPRWSQATERRIGESGRRETLLFNGYADEVASLYSAEELDDTTPSTIYR